jgi:hypothetical protein
MKDTSLAGVASPQGRLHKNGGASRVHGPIRLPTLRNHGRQWGLRTRALHIRRRILLRVLSSLHILQVLFHLHMA